MPPQRPLLFRDMSPYGKIAWNFLPGTGQLCVEPAYLQGFSYPRMGLKTYALGCDFQSGSRIARLSGELLAKLKRQ